MKRRVLAIILIVLSACLLVLIPVMIFTAPGQQVLVSSGLLAPTPTPSPTATPIPPTPTPIPTPKPILTARGQPPTVSAKIAYLQDMDSGSVLVNVNGTQTAPMASTTKVMTSLIAIQTGKLDQVITVKQKATTVDGSTAGLVAGEQLTLKELLYALLLPSGNDAAAVIADALAGSSENFVQRMNLFAARLHLFQTHYATVDGLTLDFQTNPNHYTSAADMARLASYALKNSIFAEIVHTPRYTLAASNHNKPHVWDNTNELLPNYTGILGIKTGHTWEAGWCLVFAAQRNGHRLLGVLFNDPTSDARFVDARRLLDWGFGLPSLPPYGS
jgi:D-alanyl-D-alanine carboxypeptidase (penicillin-binding protein 5/6)